MKLERIRLSHFLSHEDTDWQPNGARLVSLVGANGAGKSSLLDAVAFALFDAARGRTDDLVQLGATDMSARVEFSFAGQLYAVERGRTRKAGGRSYLEFQVRDGETWRPLTGDSIRDTQERIAELLRMDAGTFGVAALLMQGRLNAFAEATAADRKRVLGQVLGLDVWARVEQEARGQARDLEAQVVAERAQVERMDAKLGERAGVEVSLGIAVQAVAQYTADLEAVATTLAGQTARLAEVEARLAAGDATRRLVDRLEQRVRELADQYRAAKARRDTATGAAERARAAIAGGEGAREATAALPVALDALAALEAKRDQATELDERIHVRREAHALASAEHREAGATWSAAYTAARSRVDDLTAALGALEPVPCPKCGTPVAPGRDDLVHRLNEASAEFQSLEAAKPVEPISLAMEAGQITRLDDRRRELQFDPAAITAAAAEVRRLEVLAARADAVVDAQASLAEAEQAIAEADTELARITGEGAAARDAVTAAQTELAALDPFLAERSTVEAAIRLSRQVEADIRRHLTVAQRTEAGVEAALDECRRLQDARDQLASVIAELDREAAVLRRLVTAFGANGIPARIIERTIPELERHANELLSQLRPGMELSIRSQRARKSGEGVIEALDLIVRDDAGERPLALFSGGERMSVSLALAVGLSRLVARRAGTAIRSLVVDEPDGLDLEARRSFGQALRILAHQGELERVVLVSHHEDLADVADEVYRVSKNGHGSVVELVS